MQKNINRLEVAYLEKLLSSVEMKKKPDGSLKGYGIKVDYSGIFSALRVNSAINLFSKKLNNSSNVNINKIVKSLAEYLRFYKIDYKKITIVEKNKDKDEKYFRIYEGHDDVETISLIEAKDLNQAKAKNTKHVRVSQFIRFSPKFMNKDIFFKHMALGVIGKNIVTSNEEQFNSSDNIIPTIYMDNSFWLDLSTLKNDVEQNINQNSNFGIVNLNANPSLKEEKIIEALEQTLKDASKVNSAFFGKNITMFSRYLKSNYRLLEFDLLFLEKKEVDENQYLYLTEIYQGDDYEVYAINMRDYDEALANNKTKVLAHQIKKSENKKVKLTERYNGLQNTKMLFDSKEEEQEYFGLGYYNNKIVREVGNNHGKK